MADGSVDAGGVSDGCMNVVCDVVDDGVSGGEGGMIDFKCFGVLIYDGCSYGQMDIGGCRVTFVTENSKYKPKGCSGKLIVNSRINALIIVVGVLRSCWKQVKSSHILLPKQNWKPCLLRPVF